MSIRQMRENRGWSMEEVDLRIGIPPYMQHRMENGRLEECPIELLRKYAELFDVSVFEIGRQCGLITLDDMDMFEMTFKNAHLLTDAQRLALQNAVDLITHTGLSPTKEWALEKVSGQAVYLLGGL